MSAFKYWVCFVGAAALSCCASSVPPVAKSADSDGQACPSLSRARFESCGCHPNSRVTVDVMQSTNLAENTRRKISKCLDVVASGGLNLHQTSVGSISANLNGCLKQEIEINPEVQEAVNSIAKQVIDRAPSEVEICRWQNCVYGANESCTQSTPNP